MTRWQVLVLTCRGTGDLWHARLVAPPVGATHFESDHWTPEAALGAGWEPMECGRWVEGKERWVFKKEVDG